MKDALFQFIISFWNLIVVSFHWLYTTILSDLAGFGTVAMAAWAIWVYRHQNKKEQFNQLKRYLSELKRCVKSLEGSLQKDTIAVLTRALVSELFNNFSTEGLYSLFSNADSNYRLERIEYIIQNVCKKNRDIQAFNKYSINAQLLLDTLSNSFPLYTKLLNYLINAIITYKNITISTQRFMSIITNNEVSTRLVQILSQKDDIKLIKERFTCQLYGYLKTLRIKQNELDIQLSDDKVHISQQIIEQLLNKYIFSDIKQLQKISQYQIKHKHTASNETILTNCIPLFSNIKQDFNSQEQDSIIALLGFLCTSNK